MQLCRIYGQFFEGNPSEVFQDVTSIHSLLIDLSSFTQAMGRLYPQCTGESWKEEFHFTISRLTVQHLLTLQELTKKVQLHSLPVNIRFEFQNL